MKLHWSHYTTTSANESSWKILDHKFQAPNEKDWSTETCCTFSVCEEPQQTCDYQTKYMPCMFKQKKLQRDLLIKIVLSRKNGRARIWPSPNPLLLTKAKNSWFFGSCGRNFYRWLWKSTFTYIIFPIIFFMKLSMFQVFTNFSYLWKQML